MDEVIQITKDIREEAGIDTNKLKLHVEDGKIIISNGV